MGREVLENIFAAGFTGQVYAVHPTARTIGGVPAAPALRALPEPVDLAVVAVPPSQVLSAITDAAYAGVRGAAVLTAGLGEAGPAGRLIQTEMTRVARKGGLRLVGPNCLGLICNDPAVRLDATFAATHPPTGGLAVASQSGGVGIALLDVAARTGLGVHSFISLGNKVDVSGNDLLATWTDDEAVRAAALYLESFGNPRKFARLARRFSERNPLLAVVGGRSAGGRRAGASHTAAAAAPGAALQALFAHSGVIEVSGVPELAKTARLLLSQPLPRGSRLGICGNAGVGVLAADCAQRQGLTVPQLPAALVGRLAEACRGAAGLDNPVDLGAGASPEAFGSTVRRLLDSTEVDAVLVVVAATMLGRVEQIPSAVDTAVPADCACPVQLVVLGMQAPPSHVGRAGIPVHASVDAATVALGKAVRYAAWRDAPRGERVHTEPATVVRARAIAGSLLNGDDKGRWLSPAESESLLSTHGIHPMPGRVVLGSMDAAEAAQQVGFPVVVKVAASDVIHKTDQGLVALGLTNADDVRTAVGRFERVLGVQGVPVLVQPYVSGGVELAIGMVRDPAFGPLVMVAAGGVATEVWDDRTFLLPPVTDVDALRALRALRLWPLLHGYRGSEPVDVQALSLLIQSVGQLALSVPEIAELDLNPVMANARGLYCVDVKLRLAPTVLSNGAAGQPEDLAARSLVE